MTEGRPPKRDFKKSGFKRTGDKKSTPRKPSDRKPSDRKPSDRKSSGRKPMSRTAPKGRIDEREKRKPTFPEPLIPMEITGEELPRRDAFQLQTLALENAKRVAQHLVAIEKFIVDDPERAFLHGQAAAFRAGRVGLVRERAGRAAFAAKRFEIAQKELRAALRITGSKEVQPLIARCEVELGDPRKALEIAGSLTLKELSTEGQVQLRLAAASARLALGEKDAAVVTLTCAELNKSDAPWSTELRYAYRDALIAAGRRDEADRFVAKFAQTFISPDPSSATP